MIIIIRKIYIRWSIKSNKVIKLLNQLTEFKYKHKMQDFNEKINFIIEVIIEQNIKRYIILIQVNKRLIKVLLNQMTDNDKNKH